jgi:hypothetical protein
MFVYDKIKSFSEVETFAIICKTNKQVEEWSDFLKQK